MRSKPMALADAGSPAARTRYWLAWGGLAGVACTHVLRFAAQAEVGRSDGAGMAIAERIAVVAAGLALLLAAWLQRPMPDDRAGRTPSWPAYALAGAACGVLGVVKLLGFALIEPSHLGWLMLGGDWQQHYFGWAFFRQDAWHWPPGVDTRFFQPVGTSIVFTDSYPLFALAFKLVRGVLPDTFQYVGIALALHWLLFGGFAALLGRAAGLRLLPATLMAMVLLCWPVFFQRMNQEALSAHWMLLAGLLLYVAGALTPVDAASDGAALGAKPRTLAWFTLLSLAALTHPYLCMMVFGLYIAFAFRMLQAAGVAALPRTLATTSGLIGMVCVLWYLSGGFIIGRGGDLQATPLGFYSANLLTLIDPGGFSDWVAPLPRATAGQASGFAYLGFGLGLLVLAAAIHRLRAGPLRSRPWWPLVLVCAGAAVFALSPRVTLGTHVLFDASQHVPDVLGTFRASGRFVWLPVYGIVAFTCLRLARMPSWLATALLAAALVLQVAEFDGLARRIALLRRADAMPASSLQDPRWAQLARGRRDLVLLPPPACGGPARAYGPYALLALRLHLTLNTGYLARIDRGALAAYCRRLDAMWRSDSLPGDAIYLPAAGASVPMDQARMHCETVDGQRACVADH